MDIDLSRIPKAEEVSSLEQANKLIVQLLSCSVRSKSYKRVSKNWRLKPRKTAATVVAPAVNLATKVIP